MNVLTPTSASSIIISNRLTPRRRRKISHDGTEILDPAVTKRKCREKRIGTRKKGQYKNNNNKESAQRKGVDVAVQVAKVTDPTVSPSCPNHSEKINGDQSDLSQMNRKIDDNEDPLGLGGDVSSLKVSVGVTDNHIPIPDKNGTGITSSDPKHESGSNMILSSNNEEEIPCTAPVNNDGGNHTPKSCDTGIIKQRMGSVSGILKHVSQFDTPCSAKSSIGRRVQFASIPQYKESNDEERGISRLGKDGSGGI